jgi:hypothetical protein
MDREEKRRERVERYTRRVEIRWKVEQRGGNKLARGVRQGVRPRMKIKEIATRGSVEECVVPKWRTSEARPTKRQAIESGVSSRDTNSSRSSSSGLRDQVTNSEPLGYYRVPRPRRKMRCGVEAQEKGRKMEDPLVVGENNW